MTEICPATGTFKGHLPWEYINNSMRMAGIGFWQYVLEADSSITFRVNDSFLAMTGCDQKDFPLSFDDYIVQFIHQEDRGNIDHTMRNTLVSRGPKFDVQHRLLNRQTGQWRWVHLFGEIAPNDGKEAKGYGCLVDIHEARTAQEKLEAETKTLQTEQCHLQTVIKTAGVLTWDWDLISDKVTYGPNPSVMEIAFRGETGTARHDHWSAVLADGERQKIIAAKEKHCRGEANFYEAEIQVRLPDGQIIWTQDRGLITEHNDAGQPSRMIGITMDVTRYKATAEALTENRRRLDQIIKTAEVATWDWNVATDTLVVNANYNRLLGLKKGTIGSTIKEWSNLLHPDDQKWTLKDLTDMIEGHTNGCKIEMRIRHRDGHYIWAYGFFKALEHDQNGRALRLAGVQIDFTDKKKLEEAQAEALKTISRQKKELERQLSERTILMSEIQRQVETLLTAPGNRQDNEQKKLKAEMLRLQDELSRGEDAAEGTFSDYMRKAFKFIANERVWYKAVLDNLPFPTSVFDLNRKWTYLNPATAQAMNKTVAGLINQHYREGWKKYQDTDITFAEGEAGKRFFTRYLSEYNKFFSCQSSILLDEHARAIGFIETMQDVTDAHEADERVRLMLDVTPLACVFFGPDGQLIDCNQATAELCGLSDKNLYLKNFTELMSPVCDDGKATMEMLLEKIQKAFKTGEADFAMTLRTVQGVDIPSEAHLVRVEWRGGFIVLGYFRDMRSLLAAQAEADRERLLMQHILEGCPVPFFIDVAGTAQYTTPFTQNVLDLKPGDETEKIIVDRKEMIPVEEELKNGRKVNWLPVRLYLKDGIITENLLNAYNAEYESQPATMVWIMDVTELKENERQLQITRDIAEESTRVKSDFLANMSHEIRTPMNAIIGLTHLLLQTDMNRQQKEYVLKTDAAAKSLLRLINDILDFSKIEAGRLEILPREFYLADILKNAVDLVSTTVSQKGLEFLLLVKPDIPSGLIGDDMRLLQILNNLISNAVKFTTKGEISLTVKMIEETAEEAVLQFEVRDTGIGLSDEQTAKIFQAFTQADTSTTRSYGGTGLGLAISKSLVKMMNGEIWCKSQPGLGSLFGFTARLGRHSNEKRYVERCTDFTGLTALAVDDNDLALTILGEYLRAMGFTVFTASSGLEALDLIAKAEQKQEILNLILIDWCMPGMDGIETTRRINELTAPDRIPAVIMATAYGCEEVSAQASSVGIKTILPKPLSPSVLLNVLSAVFNEKDTALKERKLASAAKGRDAADLVRHLAGSSILLVEDNEVNQLVARKILRKAGLKVTVANNGLEALSLLDKELFDLVLMDIQMPVMDGLTATREIRHDPKFKNLPIVAMTAHAMAQDREKSLDCGMNDHICKPLDLNELFRCLAKWLEPLEQARETDTAF